MNLDDLSEAVEHRQALSSPALRKICGLHVVPMTFEEAQADFSQVAPGVGRDFDGIKIPNRYDYPSAQEYRRTHKRDRTEYMRGYRERKAGKMT